MDLLIDTLPAKTQLGAVEFGSGIEHPGSRNPRGRHRLPARAGRAERGRDGSRAETNINADNGATDYNGAFAKADADNPTAQARIFLTDGGHDDGTYEEAHLAHNVPTYVIGFGPHQTAKTKRG